MNSRAIAFLVALLGATSTHAYELTGFRWPGATIQFAVGDLCNSTNFPETPGNCSGNAANPNWEGHFQVALSRWNSASDYFNYTNTTTEIDSTCDTNDANSTFFGPDFCGNAFGATTLAVSFTASFPSNNEAVHTDIIFNTAENWEVFDTAWNFTDAEFRRVAVHEAGHSLGLDHTDLIDTPRAIMEAFAGDTIEPQVDDIAALEYIYGHRDSDLDGDWNHDVLLRRASDGAFTLYRIDAQAVESVTKPPLNRNNNWQLVAMEEFDNANGRDLLFRNSVNGNWFLGLINNGTVTASALLALPTSSNWQFVTAADFNGDETADILIRNTVNGTWRVYLMNGVNITGQGVVAITTNTNWGFVEAGDYDRDGNADVLIRNTNNGQWRQYRLNGTTVVGNNTIMTLPTSLDWVVNSTQDHSGDGVPDLLLRNASSGRWRMYILNGPGIRASGVMAFKEEAAWDLVAVLDTNFDGRADVLQRNNINGRWRIFLVDGTTIDSTAIIGLPTSGLWEPVAAGDFDKDAVEDILLRNSQNGRWSVFTLDETSISTNGSVGLTTSSAWQPVTLNQGVR